MLLLHGFSGAPSSFDAVVQRLPAGTQCEVPYLCGHGMPPAGAAVKSFEAEVDRLARRLSNSESVVVVGYSLGARLALGLIVRHPARVRALLLVSGNAGMRLEAERVERREQDQALAGLLEREGLETFVQNWEKQPLFVTQALLPEPLQQAERARRQSHTAQGLAHALRTTGLGQMPNYWPLLPTIRAPVEALAGELDLRFRALGRAIAGDLPAGRFTVVPGAGHNLLLERPDWVAAAIVRGLSS